MLEVFSTTWAKTEIAYWEHCNYEVLMFLFVSYLKNHYCWFNTSYIYSPVKLQVQRLWSRMFILVTVTIMVSLTMWNYGITNVLGDWEPDTLVCHPCPRQVQLFLKLAHCIVEVAVQKGTPSIISTVGLLDMCHKLCWHKSEKRKGVERLLLEGLGSGTCQSQTLVFHGACLNGSRDTGT